MQRFEKHVFLKQPTMGGPPTWGLGEGLTTPYRKKTGCNEMLHRASDLDRFFETI